MFLTKEKKSPYWYVVYKDASGKRVKKTTGKTSKEAAKREVRSICGNSQTNHILLSDFEDEYIEFMRLAHSGHYIRSIKSAFKNLRNNIPEINIADLDVRMLEKFIYSVYSKSPAAAALYYRTLKAAFSKAEIWNYIKSNPLKKIKLPKIPKSYPVFITRDQLDIIIESTERESFRKLFLFAFHTGLRLSEILNLKWDSINLSSRKIEVHNRPGYNTKNKKPRIIPMNKTLYGLMTNMKADNNIEEYVFHNPKGKRYLENYVSKEFKKSVRRAGLNEGIHFHTLRHSFASSLVQSGISLAIIKELLGHDDIKTTEIYAHLEIGNLTRAVELLD